MHETIFRFRSKHETSLILHDTFFFFQCSAVWGFLCVLMNKADNVENRRACYDVWKRKRVKFQPIVDELLQRNTLQSTVHHFDASSISTDDVKEMADTNRTTKYSGTSDMSELNTETPVNVPVNVCKIAEINI